MGKGGGGGVGGEVGGGGGGGCGFKRGEHEVRYVHGGVRVSADVRFVERSEGGEGEDRDWREGLGLGGFEAKGEDEKGKEKEKEKRKGRVEIEMWESCKICGMESERKAMSDGTL
jgi:1-phosphatidylinositol-3-phosphate 5-kinase